MLLANLYRGIYPNYESFRSLTYIKIDVKPKEGIEKREEKGRTRKNRGRTGDAHGQARSCVAVRMGRNGTNSEEQGTHGKARPCVAGRMLAVRPV